MKGNNGSGNNVSRDDWRTPKELFNTLNNQYNFAFDCCASKENRKCELYSDDFQNEWLRLHRAWINPPFSKATEMIDHFFDRTISGIGIYRIDNIESYLWNFILNNADWVFIIRGRTNYEGHEGHGARFGSALFGVGVPPPENIEGVALKRYS